MAIGFIFILKKNSGFFFPRKFKIQIKKIQNQTQTHKIQNQIQHTHNTNTSKKFILIKNTTYSQYKHTQKIQNQTQTQKIKNQP